MSVYLNLRTVEDSTQPAWPGGKRLSFMPAKYQTETLKNEWFDTTGMLLDVWASYFEPCPFDLALAVVSNPDHKSFTLTAGYVAERPQGDCVTQFSNASGNYVSFSYNLQNGSASLAGAHVASGAAHRAGFVGHVLTSLQNYAEETDAIQNMSVLSTQAGVYTWASYGAVPKDAAPFHGALQRQLEALAAKAPNLAVLPTLRKWVADYQQTSDDQMFRAIFKAAAESKAQGQTELSASLKALFLGDARFLSSPQYRFSQMAATTADNFADPMNGMFIFTPQDAEFQRFFRARVEHLGRQP